MPARTTSTAYNPNSFTSRVSQSTIDAARQRGNTSNVPISPTGQYTLAQKIRRLMAGQATIAQSVNQPGGAFSRYGGGGFFNIPGSLIGGVRTDQSSPAPGQPNNGSGVLPLSFGANAGDGSGGGGGGGGLSAQAQAAAAAQKAAIEAARQRYSDYYKAQKAELQRQLDEQTGNINDLRTTATTQGQATELGLGQQNISTQAGINKQAQASGIYDSSARVGAIGQTQANFETALGDLHTQQATYFKNLDTQLNDLKHQFTLNNQNLDLTNADKVQQFNDAMDQLDAQIEANRQKAISMAASRSQGQAKFFSDLSSLVASSANFSPEFQASAIDQLASNYGVNPQAARQQFNIAQAIQGLRTQGTDPQVAQSYSQYLQSIYGPNYRQVLGLGG